MNPESVHRHVGFDMEEWVGCYYTTLNLLH